ncbi:GIY-YIG nuclease family protein [Cyclobacteriaceae bacterium YHN15]|nr:GIY-YIG nuclease family protein [Cyclobacteriaceae bacterium YHN15]
MSYILYIIYSHKLGKDYIGQTSDLDARMKRHNGGRNPFTKRGVPWELVHFLNCDSRAEAMKLEKRIKNLGAKRFLERLKFG